jgi:hypothetical protein
MPAAAPNDARGAEGPATDPLLRATQVRCDGQAALVQGVCVTSAVVQRGCAVSPRDAW